MTKMKVLGAGLLATSAALISAVGFNYHRDLAAAHRRISVGDHIIKTACGTVEYGEYGQGKPILVIHGAGQGFDQSIWMARQYLGGQYRVIAPSRFGYLNSPVPENSSVEAQADLYASLLDELGINKVVVMTISAGGPSALQFALSYPQRTEALVLISTFDRTTHTQADAERQEMIYRLVGSDLVYWMAVKFDRPLLFSTFGVSKELQAGLSPADWEIANAAVEGMLPMSRRLPGIKIDSSLHLPEGLPLEKISVPALVFHARDDALITYDKGRQIADNLPDARFVSFDTGGHFLLGHYDEIRAELNSFLAGSFQDS